MALPDIPHALLLLLTAVLGGALNAVAGGGSFLTFPALVFAGLDPVVANASSTVALWPGSLLAAATYRRDITMLRGMLLPMVGAAVTGGLCGALLLVGGPPEAFRRLAPWLLLFAAVLFTFGPRVTARLALPRDAAGHGDGPNLLWLVPIQLVISVYGGYFGGGMGIMMLASYVAFGLTDLHAMNGLKSLLAVVLNGVAVTTFIASGAVSWPEATLMTAGAAAGGHLGATWAKRVPPAWLRAGIATTAWLMTLWFFTR